MLGDRNHVKGEEKGHNFTEIKFTGEEWAVLRKITKLEHEYYV